MQDSRRLIRMDDANAKVKELAARLLRSDLGPALDTLGNLADGSLYLFTPPKEEPHGNPNDT